MTEGTSASAPTSETAKPEQSSSPPAKSGRKLWPMIAAIVVVLLLVGVVAYVYVIAPGGKADLSATITPDPCVVDAGTVKQVSVWPLDGDKNLSATGSGATYLWSVSPSSLGSFELSAQRSVNFAAGDSAGTGTLTCRVKYEDVFFNATASLEVLAPYLDTVVISPSTKTVGPGLSQEFVATAINSVGANITGATFVWAVDGLSVGDYTLNATTGDTVLFTAGSNEVANATLNATATYDGRTATGSALINIGGIGARSVVYRWYDIFNCPFSFAWYMRAQIYPDDQPISDSYPYIFKWYGEPAGNMWYYTMMRMNMTAKNLPEISMSTNPWFIPMFGTSRGGNAEIRWHLYYPSWDEVNASYGDAVSGNYEGWLVTLKGSITLDMDAAMTVLGITSSQFDDFATWWTTNGYLVQSNWQTWITDQSRHEFDIWCAYEFDINMLGFSLNAQKVGDKIVITMDSVSWGMEVLLTRWLRYSFMGTEWYFDEMWFNATIGPEVTNINAQTVVNYAAYAYATSLIPEGATKGLPNWMWEALVQDYMPSRPGHPALPGDHVSDYDIYKNLEYLNMAPGSPYYGEMMSYDYAPGVQNLSENETLIFEWPSGQQLFYVDADGSVLEVHENMTCDYAEPMPSDMGALGIENTQITLDSVNRTLTFEGPADFWNWSRLQDAVNHEGLADEWDRIGVLPYGMPTIEFRADIAEDRVLTYFDVEDIASPIVVGDAGTVTVTARDQLGDVFTDYTGTVQFSTNGTGGDVNLPSDYPFVAGDSGVHTFPISFNTAGYFTVSVNDLDDPAITGSQTDIRVIETPHIDRFVVVGPSSLAVSEVGSISVTAIDQNDLVLSTYDGLISFTTDAPGGTYSLPADYQFLAGDNGVKAFSNSIAFAQEGSWTITVTDIFNMTATGTLGPIVVEVRSPEESFTLYDMFKEPLNEVWTYRFTGYAQDYIIGNTTDAYTYLYDQTQATGRGIIFAPYRWNTVAKNMSSVHVDNPEFMPKWYGPENITGAEAEIDLYFSYLNWSWWNSYWVPTWSSSPEWASTFASIMGKQTLDGYYLGTVYNVTLNREAAYTWLNMSTTDDPDAWWLANRSAYRTFWINWILNEGRKRLDIQCGYDDTYYAVATSMDMQVLPNGDISLTIGHLSWGYEVLMTRWLTEANIVNHEPYWEDFTLEASYKETFGDVTFDGVGQYNLHAVKANESATGLDAAWVWEPIRIDYVASFGIHPSQFDPWSYIFYTSWNTGDPEYGNQVGYDATPGWLNLTSYQKLTVQMPLGDNVIGYTPEPRAPPEAVYEMAYNNNYSWYENHTIYGEMSLGYWITDPLGGGADLDSMYDDVAKTLTIVGPQIFDQVHWTDGQIYHGTPWIEFNVTPPPKAMAAATPPDVTEIVGESSAGTLATEAVSLAAVLACVVAVVFALWVPIRRREY